MPILTVQDLTIDFRSQRGHTRAVAGVSLTVNRGEVVAIVGESGSGKSVTSLALLGLLAKPAAHIASGGEAWRLDPHQARSILSAYTEPYWRRTIA